MTRSQPGGQRAACSTRARRAGQLHVDEGARAVDRAPLADGLARWSCSCRSAPRWCRSRGTRRLAAARASRRRRAPRRSRPPRRSTGGARPRRRGPCRVMKSTCALTTAMLRCVPPWRTNFRPAGAQVLELARVDPHVDRQHGGQRRHDLLGRPALALLVHDVGLEEHAAAHGERRHRLGLEGPLGVLLERNAVALGHALQERAVAGRALRVQPEVRHRALAEDHDLDVGAADVADHVGVGEEVERGGGVRHRLDDRDVGAEHVPSRSLP